MLRFCYGTEKTLQTILLLFTHLFLSYFIYFIFDVIQFDKSLIVLILSSQVQDLKVQSVTYLYLCLNMSLNLFQKNFTYITCLEVSLQDFLFFS